jgi:hypothetical protein
VARRRIIDPKFWTDPLNGRVAMPVRLLYIGIWTHADDAGLLANDAGYLRAAIFPHDRRIREQDVRAWLTELEGFGDPGRLLPYEFGGRRLYLVTRFHEHQTINRPTKSTLPRPPEALLERASPKSREIVIERTEKPALSMLKQGSESRTAHAPLSEPSVSLTAKGSEVKGSEVNARARADESLRSGGRGREVIRVACQRPGCGHAWIAHRGPGDPAFTGARECVVADCLCGDYLEHAPVVAVQAEPDVPDELEDATRAHAAEPDVPDTDQPYDRVRERA